MSRDKRTDYRLHRYDYQGKTFWKFSIGGREVAHGRLTGGVTIEQIGRCLIDAETRNRAMPPRRSERAE